MGVVQDKELLRSEVSEILRQCGNVILEQHRAEVLLKPLNYGVEQWPREKMDVRIYVLIPSVTHSNCLCDVSRDFPFQLATNLLAPSIALGPDSIPMPL